MRQIGDMKPTPPVAKPVLPWAAFGTAAMLIMLLLGAMNHILHTFRSRIILMHSLNRLSKLLIYCKH